MSESPQNVASIEPARTKRSLKQNLQHAGMLLMRQMASMRAGLAFGGKRDLYTIFGYPHTVTSRDLLAKYERQDIAQRIVDKPAEGIWMKPPVVTSGITGFDTAFETLVKRIDLWTHLFQADRLCAFGPYSALLLGLPGDPEAMASGANPKELQYVRAYGADNAIVDSVEDNYLSPRYGLPLFYRFNTQDPNMKNVTTLALRAHWSRVVHIVDKPLMGNMMSIPRLQYLYNVLEDILKVAGGSAETYWLTANRGMQADVDKEMELDEPDAEQLADEIEEYQHGLRRFLRTRGVKITNLGSDVADPSGVFRVLIALVSAATGIPQRILIGAEAGQLASEQDRANWTEFVESRRKYFAEPYVLRPFVHHLQTIGILPKTQGNLAELEYDWPEAFHLSPLERSQTMAQFGRAIVNLSRRNEKGNPIVSDEECREALGLPRDPPAGDTFPEMPEPPAPGAPGADDPNDPDEAGPNRPNRPGQQGPQGE
jgi:hypothetical protein